MELLVGYFYQLLLLVWLPDIQLIVPKKKRAKHILAILISLPAVYLLVVNQHYGGLLYILASLPVVIYVNSLSTRYQNFWMVNILCLGFFWLPLINLKWQIFQPTSVNLLLFSTFLTAYIYRYKKKTLFGEQSILNLPPKACLSISILSLSIISLLINFLFSKSDLPLTEDNQWNLFFTRVVVFEFISKISLQHTLLNQTFNLPAVTRIILSAIFILPIGYLFYSWNDLLLIALMVGLITAILFEAFGLIASVAFHSLIWIAGYFLIGSGF